MFLNLSFDLDFWILSAIGLLIDTFRLLWDTLSLDFYEILVNEGGLYLGFPWNIAMLDYHLGTIFLSRKLFFLENGGKFFLLELKLYEVASSLV